MKSIQNMEGIQKVKCNSCGTMFMSENNVPFCPSCIDKQGHGDMHACGCGHSH